MPPSSRGAPCGPPAGMLCPGDAVPGASVSPDATACWSCVLPDEFISHAGVGCPVQAAQAAGQ